MKRLSPVVVLLIGALYISITGFQCGSTEMTTAKLAMQQKQWEKAEESLLKEVEKNEQNDEAWFLLGSVRLELGKYKLMNEAYTKSLQASNQYRTEISANRLFVWGKLLNEGVQLFNNDRDFTKAIENFETAIALVPDSAYTYYVNGLAYSSKKDYDKAVANLKTALQKNPKMVDAALGLGQVYQMIARAKRDENDEKGSIEAYKQSAAAYEIAYKADPKDLDNMKSLIEAYDRSNEPEKALQLTRDCIDRDPNDRVCRYAYGVYLLKQEKFDESVVQFKKTIELKQDESDEIYRDAMYNCGVAYLNWGVALKAESDKQMEAAMKKGTRDAKEDSRYKEKYRASLPYLEKAGELRKDDMNLWLQLGRVYANLNMGQKAKEAFKRADSIGN